MIHLRYSNYCMGFAVGQFSGVIYNGYCATRMPISHIMMYIGHCATRMPISHIMMYIGHCASRMPVLHSVLFYITD